MEFLKDLVPIQRKHNGLNSHVITVSITEMPGKKKMKKEKTWSSYGAVELTISTSSSEWSILS